MRVLSILIAVSAALVFAGPIASAEDEGKGETPRKPAGGENSFHTSDKTNIDFSETMIDGKMQAPQGFFLQGRQAQSMAQMVKLRSKWRSELRNSKAAVKALAK